MFLERLLHREGFWNTPEGLKRIKKTPCHFTSYYEYAAIYEDTELKDLINATEDEFSPSQIAVVAKYLNQQKVRANSKKCSEHDYRHIPHGEMSWPYEQDVWKFSAPDMTIEFRLVNSKGRTSKMFLVNDKQVAEVQWVVKY